MRNPNEPNHPAHHLPRLFIGLPEIYGLVAEADGRVVGAVFLVAIGQYQEPRGSYFPSGFY